MPKKVSHANDVILMPLSENFTLSLFILLTPILLFHIRDKSIGKIKVTKIHKAVTTLSTAIVPAYKIPFF